jgi:hypothetical protein
MKDKLKFNRYITVLTIGFVVLTNWGLKAQNCYIRLFDASGIAPSQDQITALETAACRLRDSLPLI